MRLATIAACIAAILTTPAMADCSLGTTLVRTDDRRGVSTKVFEINGVAVKYDDLFAGYHPDEITAEQYDILRRRGVGTLQRQVDSDADFRINIVPSSSDAFAVIRIEKDFLNGNCDEPFSVTTIPVNRTLFEE